MASLASPSAVAGSHGGGGGSSATVLEFVCLFTHDLRRKQKRWQDGRLKYHTFNKRVMVYDDRGNFVGDMYWRRDWEFDEGEEIELERGGVAVQVAECVGRQNQDLSELIDKRAKEKEQRAAARPAAPPVPMHTPLSINRTPIAQRDHFQTRHRPLNQLLGTPTGHHGRAVVPTESPYEQRHAADRTPDEESSSRAQKRRRYDDLPFSKMGYAQALFGAPLTLSGAPMSSTPVRRPALSRPQPRIDLISSQEDGPNNSGAVETTNEQNHHTRRSSPAPEMRPAPRRVEQPSRAPVTLPKAPQTSVQKEMKSQPRNGENRDVPQRPDHSTGGRGVSRHFNHASEESQRRASLLKSAGLSRVQARELPSAAVGKRADGRIQPPNQRLSTSRQPEPITIPDGRDSRESHREIQDLEEETVPAPVRQKEVNKSKKSVPEAEAGNLQRERKVGRSTGLFKSNAFAHSSTNTEPETPPTHAPDPVPPVEARPVAAPVKEPRTELRIKSRGRSGLLLMAEMTKEASATKKRKKRAPPPEIAVQNNLEEQYDIPDQDLLDLPDPTIRRASSPKVGSANDHRPNAQPFDLDDSDPFASLEPAASKDTAGAARETAPADADDSDPFASQEPLVRKRSKLVSRREQARAKQIHDDGSMDMEDDDDLAALRNSSPEIIQRTKRTSLDQANSTVYDIPEDTEAEQTFLPRQEKSPPEPKKRANNRERNRKQSRRKSVEEDAASDPESEDLPRARTTRTSKRKAEKAAREEESSEASVMQKRARPVLAFLDEPSSEDELPKPPPKVTKTSRASKASKAAKPTRAPRLGGKLKSTVKSREVFGFVMSSSPPPPVLGGAPVPANQGRPTFLPNNGIHSDQAGGFSAPVSNVNGFANGPKSALTAATGNLDANPALDSRTNVVAPSLQIKNPDTVMPQPKDPAPPRAQATSAALAAHGESSRRRTDANDQAGSATNGEDGTNAAIPTEKALDNRATLPPATEASTFGTSKGPTAPQPKQPVHHRENSGGLCDVGGGTRALRSASHNNVPDPVPAQTRGRQTITANTRPETQSTVVAQQGGGSGAMLPPPVGPPSRPAPPALPKAQTRPQVPVRPPIPTTVVPPATTFTSRGMATTAPPPPPVVTTTAPTVTTTNLKSVAPSVNITATSGIPATDAAPASVAVPVNVPPRIQNPASRGRKAALKSDAKGQTPQSILPPPEPLADGSNLAANRAAPPRPGGAGGQEERPKLKMTFPGFVSAREGGPWSREAHDLLGGGRPV